MANLSVDMVRNYLSDYPENNYITKDHGKEMTDTFITMCIGFAIDSFNNMSPRSVFTLQTHPSSSVLLFGTCFFLYQGLAPLLARNTMQYSDGGVQIPIEERTELYMNIANGFNTMFQTAAKQLKIELNMEGGWGSLSSDESIFPVW